MVVVRRCAWSAGVTLVKFLYSMSKTWLFIVGDAFVDVLAGPLNALPQWNADVECSSIRQLAGGSALNVAIHLGVLCSTDTETQANCSFHGLVGNDDFSSILRKRLLSAGVHDSMGTASGDVGTGVCIVLSGQGERGFVTQTGATSCLSVDHLDEIEDKVQSASREHRLHLHISGFYSLSTLRPQLPAFLRELRAIAEARGAEFTTSLDTNGDATQKWEGGIAEILPEIDILLPNDAEALGIAHEQSVTAAADALARRVRKAVLVTCGADGTVYQTREGAEAGLPPRATRAPPGVTPVDVTGAGDAFDAGFLYSWAVRAESVEEGVLHGSCAGAMCTQTMGANTAPATAPALRDMAARVRSHVLLAPPAAAAAAAAAGPGPVPAT